MYLKYKGILIFLAHIEKITVRGSSKMSSKKIVNGHPDLESAVRQYMKSGSSDAQAEVIRLGRELADFYAGIYSPGEIDDTLKQAAHDGFTLALKKYDSSKKILFTSYATYCIISEIRQELRARQLFRVPDWLKRLQNDVVDAAEELTKKNSTVPTLKDIATKINITESGITEAMQAGKLSIKEIYLSKIKSTRLEPLKLPIEDVIAIRKSLDRLSNIQKKVLSLIAANLRELSLAIEEEELALTKTQAQYMRLVEDHIDIDDCKDFKNSFKVDFPEDYSDEEVRRYFEVLADEFGLRILGLTLQGGYSKSEDNTYVIVPLEIILEGRFRGLLQLLDYLRNEENAVYVDRVKAVRNDNIPASITVIVSASTYYKANNFDQSEIK